MSIKSETDKNRQLLCLILLFLVSQQKNRKKMARRQKEIIMPHLNNCGGDLTKKWYVEYSIRNPKTQKTDHFIYSGWYCYA